MTPDRVCDGRHLMPHEDGDGPSQAPAALPWSAYTVYPDTSDGRITTLHRVLGNPVDVTDDQRLHISFGRG